MLCFITKINNWLSTYRTCILPRKSTDFSLVQLQFEFRVSCCILKAGILHNPVDITRLTNAVSSGASLFLLTPTSSDTALRGRRRKESIRDYFVLIVFHLDFEIAGDQAWVVLFYGWNAVNMFLSLRVVIKLRPVRGAAICLALTQLDSITDFLSAKVLIGSVVSLACNKLTGKTAGVWVTGTNLKSGWESHESWKKHFCN